MRVALTITACALLAALTLPPTRAGAETSPGHDGPRSDLIRWRAAEGGFDAWELSGLKPTPEGEPVLDPETAQAATDTPGGFHDRNFYNGAAYHVGEATSPETPVDFGFRQAIASWNADTPPGTWIEVLVRLRLAGRWSGFYNLGVWARDSTTVERHSVDGQRDGDAWVAVDTVVVRDSVPPADAFQVRVRLFSAHPGEATPRLTLAAAAVSTPPGQPPATSSGDPARWGATLDVPACSQQPYPDGGEVWCSPTATSMVVGFWTRDAGPCEPRVRAAVGGVYDWVFEGHGNWPFNTAYAAGAAGLEGYVTRLPGLAEAERWIAAGVPVVMSYSWDEGELPGAPLPASKGHLGVLVGFDDSGNPVVNDPAGATDGEVRRVYPRAEFEALWLGHSAGTVYVIHPPGHPTP